MRYSVIIDDVDIIMIRATPSYYARCASVIDKRYGAICARCYDSAKVVRCQESYASAIWFDIAARRCRALRQQIRYMLLRAPDFRCLLRCLRLPSCHTKIL